MLYIIKDPAEMSLITPPLLLVFLLMNPGESTLSINRNKETTVRLVNVDQLALMVVS